MKTSLKTAASQKRNEFDNGSVHITTLDFGKLRPTYCLNVRRGDKIFLDYTQFTRLSPLAAPTFGSAKIKSYAFWVPLRTIWQSYKNFMSDSVDSSVNKKAQNGSYGDILQSMFFKNASDTSYNWQYLLNLSKTDFLNLEFNSDVPDISVTTLFNTNFVQAVLPASYSDTDVLTNLPGDIQLNTNDFFIYLGHIADDDNRAISFSLTPLGREFINTLISLGYPYSPIINTVSDNILEFPVNLTPLVAYFRCLYDFVFPSEYVNQLGVGYLFDDYDFTGHVGDIGQLASTQVWMEDALKLLFAPYEQDFYNSLWLTPNRVAAGEMQGTSSPAFPAGGVTTLNVNSDENSTSIAQDSASARSTVTAHALQWMQAMSDFIVRNNIGGERFAEFMKAHTGWQSSMDTIEQSQFLKSWVDSVNMMDVTQTSESTSQSVLGEQAGKGISNGRGSLRFEAKEDGFIIVLTMVTPVTAYYQGVAPWCEMLSDRKELYQEEFDSVGMEPIPLSSIWLNNVNKYFDSQHEWDSNAVFGFAPRYSNRYKRRFDRLSGMFRFPSMNVGLDSYHTFRDLMYGRDNVPANDAQFKQVDNQFDRIFASTPSSSSKDTYERFLTIFNFDVKRVNTMKSISASMPLFNKSGESTSIDYEGTQI